MPTDETAERPGIRPASRRLGKLEIPLQRWLTAQKTSVRRPPTSSIFPPQRGQETTLPVALFNLRFSRDGRWIAGASREREVVVCDVSVNRCRPLTPKHDYGVAALAWSGDGTRLFFLRHTGARVLGELMSVSVAGGAAQRPASETIDHSLEAAQRLIDSIHGAGAQTP